MQTRKRAKSVTFGKKEKKEKETLKENEVSVASEKAEEKEEKVVEEKHHEDELSAVPPKTESTESEDFEITTPASEFVTDSTPAAASEEPKAPAGEPAHSEAGHATEPTGDAGEAAAPGSTLSDNLSAPEEPAPQVQPAQPQELSPTPPQSAITILN